MAKVITPLYYRLYEYGDRRISSTTQRLSEAGFTIRVDTSCSFAVRIDVCGYRTRESLKLLRHLNFLEVKL